MVYSIILGFDEKFMKVANPLWRQENAIMSVSRTIPPVHPDCTNLNSWQSAAIPNSFVNENVYPWTFPLWNNFCHLTFTVAGRFLTSSSLCNVMCKKEVFSSGVCDFKFTKKMSRWRDIHWNRKMKWYKSKDFISKLHFISKLGATGYEWIGMIYIKQLSNLYTGDRTTFCKQKTTAQKPTVCSQ